ncbi:hypothetical protein [Microbacterium sp. LWH3-1.2]|uniref:hypothetical protein n=1 Tax=Microbacterium sp. LWH3-1.2 TaxID=3135256 RepID=UPI0034493704
MLLDYVQHWEAMVASAKKVEVLIQAKTNTPRMMFDTLNRLISGPLPAGPLWQKIWADFGGVEKIHHCDLQTFTGEYVKNRVNVEQHWWAFAEWRKEWAKATPSNIGATLEALDHGRWTRWRVRRNSERTARQALVDAERSASRQSAQSRENRKRYWPRCSARNLAFDSESLSR